MQQYGEEEWDVVPTPTQEPQGYTQYPRGTVREYGAAEQGMRGQRVQRFDRPQPPPRQQSFPQANRQQDRMLPLERRGDGNAVISQRAANMEGMRVQQGRARGVHVPDAAVYVIIVSLLALALYAISMYELRGAAQAGFLACAGIIVAGAAFCGAYAFRENRALLWGCVVLAVFALALLTVEVGQATVLTPPLHIVLPPHR